LKTRNNKAVFVLWQGIALVAILVSLLAVGLGPAIVYAGDGGNTSAGGASTSGDGAITSGGDGAAAAGNSFTATIDPDGFPVPVDAGSTNTFQLTVKNVSSGLGYWFTVIGRVEVQVPGDFTNVNDVEAWAYYTHPWSPNIPHEWSDTGINAQLISAQADTWAECVRSGDYVVISFEATAPSPPVTTAYPFDTTAYTAYPVWVQTGKNWWNGSFSGVGIGCEDKLAKGWTQPEVTVGALTQPTPPPVAAPALSNLEWQLGQVPVSTPVLVVDVLGTVARYPVTNDGVLLVDALTTSPDGLLKLLMLAGTQVLNPDGSPAYLNKDPDVFSISAATPQPPAGYTMVAAYQFLPSGIIFRPDATLIIKYNAEKMPAGGAPVIAYYDEAAGQWINLETAGYVAAGVDVPNTVQAHTAHLTYFAVLAK